MKFLLGLWIPQRLGENDDTGHSVTLATVASTCSKKEDNDIQTPPQDYQPSAVNQRLRPITTENQKPYNSSCHQALAVLLLVH